MLMPAVGRLRRPLTLVSVVFIFTTLVLLLIATVSALTQLGPWIIAI